MNRTTILHYDKERQRLRAAPAPVMRGLNRETAAAYIGVSTSLFDQMVGDGRMPKPKTINSRRVWDLHAVDRAFEQLPGDDAPEEIEGWEARV